jgi:aspartate dehydrogenase
MGLKRIGLIGYGAIGRKVAEIVLRDGAAAGVALAAVLVRPARVDEARRALPDAVRIASDVDALVSAAPDLIAECAGHGAVRDYGAAVLESGTDLVVIGIGALADPVLERRLRGTAEKSGARIILPAGAVGGLDLLAAARLGGLDRVVYTSRKKPLAWKGTPAEQAIDLNALEEATVFYRGKARQAARDYPQNANVAAAIGLAGLGLDATDVVLTADPAVGGNEHRIAAEGSFGRAELVILGKPMPESSKTSMLAGLSLARAVLNAGARIVV